MYQSSNMPTKILTAASLMLLYFAGNAQNLPSDSTLARILQTDVLLPLLVDSAIKNSPDVDRSKTNIQVYEQNLQAARKSVLNFVSLGSSYGYGTSGNLALEKDPSGTGQLSNFSATKTSRYYMGIGVQVPLGTFLSRKQQRRTAELQIDVAETEQRGIERAIRQEVIKLYQDFKLAHALLLTTGKMKQSAYLNLSIAQKDFTGGQIGVEQMTKYQNDYHQTTMAFDTQLNRFQTSLLTLEASTGVQLVKLINRLR